MFSSSLVKFLIRKWVCNQRRAFQELLYQRIWVKQSFHCCCHVRLAVAGFHWNRAFTGIFAPRYMCLHQILSPMTVSLQLTLPTIMYTNKCGKDCGFMQSSSNFSAELLGWCSLDEESQALWLFQVKILNYPGCIKLKEPKCSHVDAQ